MLLTATKIKNAKPKEKQYKLHDGQGLYLIVTPKGGKNWHFRYKMNGRDNTLGLGKWPEISLADARERALQARKLKAHGIDPGEKRRQEKEKQKYTFEVVAREWMYKKKAIWSARHHETVIRRLELHLFPFIGDVAIRELTAKDLKAVLQRIEKRGSLETAHRVRSICSQILRYAIAHDRAERDIAQDLKGDDFIQRRQIKHHGALTEPAQVGALLRAIDDFEGSFVVKCALQLAPLVFLRPGELRHGEWREIDWKNATWDLPAHKMKIKEPHRVPLARQALEILEELHQLTGACELIFPGLRSYSRPVSEGTLNAALRRMGYTRNEMTSHGFRATARTLLDEGLRYRPDLIEHQLAHAVRDHYGRAYNRTSYIEERREMMQAWADYLDKLRTEK